MAASRRTGRRECASQNWAGRASPCLCRGSGIALGVRPGAVARHLRYLNTKTKPLIAQRNRPTPYCAWGCFPCFERARRRPGCPPRNRSACFSPVRPWLPSAGTPYSSASSTRPITSTTKPAAVAAANDRSTLSMMPPRCRRTTFPPWRRRRCEISPRGVAPVVRSGGQIGTRAGPVCGLPTRISVSAVRHP